MNGTCEMWSLPWHALQRNLALGLGGDAILHYAATVKTVNVQSAAVGANPGWVVPGSEWRPWLNTYASNTAEQVRQQYRRAIPPSNTAEQYRRAIPPPLFDSIPPQGVLATPSL
jgi:hypothetical protein